MKNHLFVTIVLATASLSSFATAEPTEADSAQNIRGTKLLDPQPGEDYEFYTPSFSATTPSGHKLFFRMINKKQKWVEVVDSCGANVYSRLTGTLVIPTTIKYGGEDYTILYIAEGAMVKVGADSVIISEGIKEIKKYAFYEGKFVYLDLPQSITSIDEESFSCCRKLLSVVVPGKNLRTIGRCAFHTGTKLESIVIEEGVLTIEEYAFYSCKVQELTLPSTIRKIGQGGIYGAYLQVVYSYIKKPFDMEYPASDFVDYGICRMTKETKMYVPAGTADLYLSTEGWNRATIIEMSVGIDETEEKSSNTQKFYSVNGLLYSKEPVIYSVYDMVGRCLYTGNSTELTLPKGLYIVKTADKAEKVMVR